MKYIFKNIFTILIVSILILSVVATPTTPTEGQEIEEQLNEQQQKETEAIFEVPRIINEGETSTDENINKFSKWTESFHKDYTFGIKNWKKDEKNDLIQLPQTETTERGVFATHDIKAGTELYSISWISTFSLDMIHVELSFLYELFEPLKLNVEDALAIGLYYYKFCMDPSDNFDLKKWVSTLPESYNSALYFSEEELELLKGSPALFQILSEQESAKELFKQLSESLFKNEVFKQCGPITYERFIWAVSTVNSRRIYTPSPDSNNNLTASIPPFVDFLNHDPNGQIEVTFNQQTSHIILSTNKPIKKGEQIFMNYGLQECNSDLLVDYGFIDTRTDRNCVEILLEELYDAVSSEDPGKAIKGQVLEMAIKNKHRRLVMKFLKDSLTEDVIKISKYMAYKYKSLLAFLKDVADLKLSHYPTTIEDDLVYQKSDTFKSLSYRALLGFQVVHEEKKILASISNLLEENINPDEPPVNDDDFEEENNMMNGEGEEEEGDEGEYYQDNDDEELVRESQATDQQQQEDEDDDAEFSPKDEFSNHHGHSHNNGGGKHSHNHHGHSHNTKKVGHPQAYFSSYNDLNSGGNNGSNNDSYNYYQKQSSSSPFGGNTSIYNNSSPLALNSLITNLRNDRDATMLFGWIVVMLCFTLYEIFYGAYLESLGLVSDGFHALFDCIGFIVCLIGMLVGRKGRSVTNQEYTYGYDRFEVLGTFSNGCFLLFVSFFLFLESVERLLEPPHIHNHERILSLAFVSLIINIVGFFFFRHYTTSPGEKNKLRNENLLTIAHHILADSCTSLGVIFSTLVGKTMDVEISDSLISIIIACIIVYDALPICIRTGKILLQTTPESLRPRIESSIAKIMGFEGVLDCSDRHFWSHSHGNFIGTINVIVKENCDDKQLLKIVKNQLSFIQNLTVQIKKDEHGDDKHKHHGGHKKKDHKHDHNHNHDDHGHHHDEHCDHDHDDHSEHHHEHHHDHGHHHDEHCDHDHDHDHDHHHHEEHFNINSNSPFNDYHLPPPSQFNTQY
eukprot:gene529-667_t